QAEDGIRDFHVTGVQTCALPIYQDQLVALDRGNHGKPDTGVAGGRLDDRATGLEHAVALGVLHHRQSDPVLDGATGIGPFRLDRSEERRVGKEWSAGGSKSRGTV